MLLLAALSAATLAVMVRAAVPTELETNKNGSEALANALRNKLMSENDDYMPRDSGEPSRSLASNEEQEPAVGHPRARVISSTREQYEDQKQESSKYIPETDDGPEDNLVEMQKALPAPSDIQNDPNAIMRHDNPKLSRNGGDDVGNNKISFHFDGKLKKKRNEYNERDERYLDKGIDKNDKLKQSQNDDKRDKSQYNDPGDDSLPKREDRHDDFKHIDQEPDKPAKLIRHTENNRIDKEAEMRRDEIDKYKYDKHNDDQRLDRTDDRQSTFYNMKKRYGNQDRPGDDRYEELSTLKNSKKSDFIQLEREKRIDIRFGKSVDPQYNDLEALKAAKREHDKRNNLRFGKSDHRRPDNLTHDKKENFKQEGEKFQLNSHVNDRLHDLSGDNRENIRSEEENNNRPYKSRFQKLNNVRPDDLRQNKPGKLTRDKMRRDESDKFKYDEPDDIRQEYLIENKNNHLKRDIPDNIKYGTRNEQKYGDNRHDKQIKLNEYDRDVFRQANDKSSKSNLKYNKYDDLRQDDLRNDKIRHTKRDEIQKDQMKYDRADRRDVYRQGKTDEIRYYDKKKQNLHAKNLKEMKNKDESYVNDNIKDKYSHKQEIKKMGLEHERIKEKKMRQDYGVDDEYNRQSSKQKLEQPRDKSNEKPREKPRGLMHSKLNIKLNEVPLKYDKLEEQLEKHFQRINPIIESDKENSKYKNNKKKEDQYIKDRNEKYKRINNEYKYKHKQYSENDSNKRYHSNRRYNKDRPFRPQQRAQVTRHPSEDYISDVKYTSVTNGVNSVYMPRYRNIRNDTNITDNVSSEHFEQKEPGVSRRDLLYYVDNEKLAGLIGTDDVVDVADVPTVETLRNAKKYKMLKTVASGRRAGEGAARVVQEEGAGGVALVALDGAALPSFQLPRARRQYMPSDHDSDYKAGDLLDDIPGLNEYSEPNLARMDLTQLSPPGLTASVQGSFDQLYSPSVDGHITPDKEGGHGRALFEAMNVKSILNE